MHSKPIIEFHIKSYHFKKRSGSRSEEVITDQQEENIAYERWTDFSGSMEVAHKFLQNELIGSHGLVAFSSHLILHFGPAFYNQFKE